MIKEISVDKLLRAIWRKLWLVVALTVVLGGAAHIYAALTTTPMYRSEALLYIYNGDKGNTSGQMSQANMSASEQTLYRYVVLIEKADVIYDIALERLEEIQTNCRIGAEGYEQYEFLLDHKFTSASIKRMISVEQNFDTELLSVYASAPDPRLAQIVAHTVTTVLQTEVPRLLDASSNYYVNTATYPTEATSPVLKYTVAGAFVGAFAAVALITLMLLFDTAIRTEDDLEELFPDIPVIGIVPDMDTVKVETRRGHGYAKNNMEM